jgi:hypothetical protein
VSSAEGVANPLLQLLSLMRRARQAQSADELAFLLVNDTHALVPYRQSVLWLHDQGVRTLSGVVQPEANAPYVHWIDSLCSYMHVQNREGNQSVTAADVPQSIASAWSDWLPAYALWLPLPASETGQSAGGLLLASEQAWGANACALLQEWVDGWTYHWRMQTQGRTLSWRHTLRNLRSWFTPREGVAWWRQPRVHLALAVVAVLLLPVRLSVLAPGELVPAHPAVIRAPMDGVIGAISVSPNESVRAGQVLFSFDESQIAARRTVAEQTLAAAQVEYRQFAQQALSDMKSKSQLALLLGKIEERRAEANYLEEQVTRSQVVAPIDGLTLFDDPSEWVGKPVQTGERVMRIAASDDAEVEVWIPLGDAIELPPSAPVELYLSSNPLASVRAVVRYFSQEAQLRPNGSYAYRLRASLVDTAVHHRVGLKGVAKVSAGWVPLVYWILRRPVATVRQTLGI